LLLCPYRNANRKPCGQRCGGRRGEVRIRDLFADERCCQAILDFLATTDVGRLAPKPAEEDSQSVASEWELRERNEREEE
jgi:hypothetical protein